MTAQTALSEPGGSDGLVRCWCCGRLHRAEDVVHLGEHPEVAVCLRCAHFLHHQSRAREDARRPSPATRARDVLRAGRRLVIRRNWQHTPVIGPVLRRLGPRLP
jgi:ribosome-binding protein aMBF1 (putative translation factor)